MSALLHAAARRRNRRRGHPAITALIVFVVVALALGVSHHAAQQPLARSVAIRDALSSASVRRSLAGTHWTTAQVSGLDRETDLITFLAGERTEVQVLLRANGTVQNTADDTHLSVPYGDWIAYQPLVLAALSLLFILMTAVTPLWRIRNLDVLATLSLLVSVVLFARRYVDLSIVAVAPGLLYLLLRCARLGFGDGRSPDPGSPLWSVITSSWTAAQRIRVLRMALITLGLVFLMVSVSSPTAVDVAYAVMEGATRIAQGVLPYGHLPGDVFHGDTYPIFSYLLYLPLAAVAPVNSTWSPVNGALAVSAGAALLAAVAVLSRVRGGIRRSATRSAVADEAGLRAAIAWLAFPPLLIIASSGTTDPALAAMLAFAVLLWRRPTVSTAILAIAGWFKLVPFLLVPLWLAPLRGRRLLTSVLALGVVSVAMLAAVVALGGIHGPGEMIHAISYQLDRGASQSLWGALGVGAVQPIAQAAVLALVVAATLRLRRDPVLAQDRRRVAALAAAILIGAQLVSNYWAFLYLAWFLPLVLMSLFDDRARVERSSSIARPLATSDSPSRGVLALSQ